MSADPALGSEEAGRKLFAGYCDFMTAASSLESLPSPASLEIAFCGRSNVGKSSLINAVTGRKSLARTSHTPGRTQELIFFAVGAPPPDEILRVVDMPGYGYAAVAKTKIDAWTKLMRAYLAGRSTLARVFVLVDGRHGLKQSDLDMCGVLDASAVSYQIVLTKADDVKISERDSRVREAESALARRPAAHPHVLLTSSRTGFGIDALRSEIAELLKSRQPQRLF